jgi:hypothetical protein
MCVFVFVLFSLDFSYHLVLVSLVKISLRVELHSRVFLLRPLFLNQHKGHINYVELFGFDFYFSLFPLVFRGFVLTSSWFMIMFHSSS